VQCYDAKIQKIGSILILTKVTISISCRLGGSRIILFCCPAERTNQLRKDNTYFNEPLTILNEPNHSSTVTSPLSSLKSLFMLEVSKKDGAAWYVVGIADPSWLWTAESTLTSTGVAATRPRAKARTTKIYRWNTISKMNGIFPVDSGGEKRIDDEWPSDFWKSLSLYLASINSGSRRSGNSHSAIAWMTAALLFETVRLRRGDINIVVRWGINGVYDRYPRRGLSSRTTKNLFQEGIHLAPCYSHALITTVKLRHDITGKCDQRPIFLFVSHCVFHKK